MPPQVPGAYRPEDVAAEVARALDGPSPERHVGGLMAAWALADSLAPNTVLRLTGALAGVGWRRRGRKPPAPDDALSEPAEHAHTYGGLLSRPSALRALRDRVGAGR